MARLLHVRQLPDNAKLIGNWAAVKAGLALDTQGLVRRLSQAEWLKARDDLEKLRGDQELP